MSRLCVREDELGLQTRRAKTLSISHSLPDPPLPPLLWKLSFPVTFLISLQFVFPPNLSQTPGVPLSPSFDTEAPCIDDLQVH